MLLKQVIEAFELIDEPKASGERIADEFRRIDSQVEIKVKTIEGEKGSTDFVKLVVPGVSGRSQGGNARTLGIVGRLGGLGARPEMIGAVSDADGAIVAIAAGLKLVDMHTKGDVLEGDVIIATHVCPDAPTAPHEPAPFMGSPVDMETMNRLEVDERMEAILSVDSTKGNEVINHNGIAISPTVKQGYILRISPDLLRILRIVTGLAPVVFPITSQDITPYGNGLYHLNSVLQPSTATAAPVVGVATTSEQIVPGSGTGVNSPLSLELATRFCLEVAKEFGRGSCEFYDAEEFQRILALYGSMMRLQTAGASKPVEKT